MRFVFFRWIELHHTLLYFIRIAIDTIYVLLAFCDLFFGLHKNPGGTLSLVAGST